MASFAPTLLTLTLPLTLTAALLTPGDARAADPPMMVPTNQLVDGRRALPLFPTTSWKDGFFLEHSAIADIGFHPRVSALYVQSPFGASEQIDDRVALYVGGVLSLLKWIDVGLVLPIAVWQRGPGFNLSGSALGDLRAITKIRVPFLGEKGLPSLAFSLGVGFPTGTKFSSFSAQGYSWIPKVIIDWSGLKGHLHVGANVSAVISGTGAPCNPLTQEKGADGLPVPCMERDVGSITGMGDHFYYGIGASAIVSPGSNLSITTELLGSFAYAGNKPGVAPLLWDIGVRYLPANKLTITGAYGRGLTNGSPANLLMVQVGYSWEVEDKKDKPNPKFDVEITVKNETVPSPASLPPPVVPAAPAPVAPPVDNTPPWQGPPPPPYAPGGPALSVPPPGGSAPGQVPPTRSTLPPPRVPTSAVPAATVPATTVTTKRGAPGVKATLIGKDVKNDKTSKTVEVPDDWWPTAK